MGPSGIARLPNGVVHTFSVRPDANAQSIAARRPMFRAGKGSLERAGRIPESRRRYASLDQRDFIMLAPVTVGFTAGIAVIIFASQLSELFGLHLAGKEPGALVPKLVALWNVADTLNVAALGVAALTIAIILARKAAAPGLAEPADRGCGGFIRGSAAVAPGRDDRNALRRHPACAARTSSARFFGGEIVHAVAGSYLFRLAGIYRITTLGRCCRRMTGRRHRSNCELVAQGVANIGSALFGGICVTGTIARTATNVRSGALGPISGMAHSLILLIFMLVAAPLASFIPLAALAGVLAVVAYKWSRRTRSRHCGCRHGVTPLCLQSRLFW